MTQIRGQRSEVSSQKSGRNLALSSLLFALGLASAMFLALCFSAQAQQAAKLPTLGYLSGGSSHTGTNPKAFWQGLRELGYVEGKNIRFEYGMAGGKVDRLPLVAAQLVALNVDIILAVGGAEPALAAKKATKTIPIVFTSVPDPMTAGLVESLARPAGNITGLSSLGAELSGKRLELLKETNPKSFRVALLWNPEYPGLALAFKESQVAARALGLQLDSVEVRSPNDFESALKSAAERRSDALYVPASQFFNRHRAKLAELAVKSRLPAMFGDRDFVEAGGLMSYGTSLADLYRRAATYVDKILKGAKPADLPVEQPMKFEFIINLKAAKQIGITIPPNVLARADKVIR
jgi:putative tryptophan/tyrosine transport system substrate-binding protein